MSVDLTYDGFSGQPQAIVDPGAAPVLMALRDCLCLEVAKTTLGRVCRCYVAWGAALPVQDGCSCACGDHDEHNGDAWVKVDNIEPDLVGGQGTNLQSWCPQAWSATISMGIYRCVPVPDADEIPDTESLTDTSLALLSDMSALWRVLSCCPVATGEGVRVVAWTPIDPTGGCAGSVLTIEIPLAGTNACP